jgi:glycosyltransferase involved in cell wall biosynthesis/protein-tyrosine-phosphatase
MLRVCHVMSADLWAGAEVQLATTVAYLRSQPDVDVSAVLFNDGPLASRLRELGLRVTILDEGRLSAFAIVRRLIGIFRDQRVDIVHTHRYKDTVLGALAAKLAGVPHLVRTVHGLREPMRGWSALKFRLYEALDRFALMCAGDLVIAVSARMADALRSRGYRPTSVTCIHNGVNVAAIAASRSADDVRRELGIAANAFVIGTIGRLSAVKGHATLLRAARLIRNKRRDLRLLIVGAGPLRRELETEAASLGIADACVFTGVREDVYDLIGAMDMFALPSLSEGIPMSVLEAMALGCPVVASRVGGVPEMIHDDETGVLVEPGDEGALAAACLRIIGDPVYAMTLGTAGRRVVAERFSSERSGRALLAAYKSVALVSTLSRRGASRPPQAPAVEAQIGPAWFCYESARLFAKRAARKIRYWIAKREVRSWRRNPGPLLGRVRRARTILMVCHGNIIRSPFAAELTKQALNGKRRVSIVSAGLQAKPGNAVPPRALRMAGGRHVDLASHTASPLTSELVAMSDLILVMDIPQLVTLRRRFPEARQRTFLLTCLAPDTPLEVADPVDGDEGMFHRCFEHITRATRPVVRAIAAAHAE